MRLCEYIEGHREEDFVEISIRLFGWDLIADILYRLMIINERSAE